MFRYAAELPPGQQFSLAVDDRTYEDASSCLEDPRLFMAQGYEAGFYIMKGNLSRSIQKVKNHASFEMF